MKQLNNLLIIGLLPFFMFSCSSAPDSLSKDKLEEYLYIPENGLTKSYSADNIKLEVTYRPSELVWYNDLKEMPKEKADSFLNTIKDRYYFVAIYTNLNESIDPLSSLAGNKALYREVLSNLSFRFEQFVTLKLSNGEEINAKGSVFSKSYGMIPHNIVLFYFETTAIQAELLSILVLDVGFRLNKELLTFEMADLEKVPNLKFNYEE